jgi:putative phosphonate metabolism protein
MTAAARRYAIYFAPPAGHPLWAAGCAWLGRDPEAGTGEAPRPHRVAPRRYGLHATLKAPFALRAGAGEDELLDAVAAFAASRRPFAMPALRVATLGDFAALRPAGALDADDPLRRLADDCVAAFDAWRRPPTAQELARRSAAGLAPAQQACLARWGYPHVFEHWRFHMTLTDGLADAAVLEAELAAARAHFAAALAVPLACEGLALFVEDAPGADFRLARRFGFAA